MSQSFQFQIGGEETGLRVDEFLASRFGSLSRMRIASLINAGACLVNQKTAQAGLRVATGDRVELAMDEGTPTAMAPEPVPLEILYEDSHLVVVVKPAGLLVHPTKNTKHGTLANALVYHLNRDFYDSAESSVPSCDTYPSSDTNPSSDSSPLIPHDQLNQDDQFAPPAGLLCESSDLNLRIESSKPMRGDQAFKLRTALHGEAHSLVRPGIVHRLDRATSGLMVIAKTPRALSTLSRHFNRRLVKKRYLALVHGVVNADEGTIKASIGRDPDSQPHWRVTESGKEAESRFFVRERFNRATLLELEPVTGRTNQLRIHCAYSGHPIIGDEMYGSTGIRHQASGSEKILVAEQNDLGNEPPEHLPGHLNGADSSIGAHSSNTSDPVPADYYATRLCLHAWRLAFHHPANGEWLEFTSTLPQDFASVIERLTLEARS
jgi:23S rRNA pseudouridine1911/1915/1917 synthase